MFNAGLILRATINERSVYVRENNHILLNAHEINEFLVIDSTVIVMIRIVVKYYDIQISMKK